MAPPPIPNDLKPWVEVRKRFGLSHAQIQMARELGFNPQKLGKLDNHRQEPWKQPLPVFIARLYQKRFGLREPAVVRTIEQIAAARHNKKQERKTRRAAERASAETSGERLTGLLPGQTPGVRWEITASAGRAANPIVMALLGRPPTSFLVSRSEVVDGRPQ